jgi:hypothetical protein
MRRILLFASLLSFLLVPALAAPAAAHDKSKETLSGCLRGPDAEGSYKLRTATRDIVVDAAAADVGRNAGHEVKVTGAWSREMPVNEKESARMIGDQAESHFKVSKIQSVASSCSQ